MYNKLLWALALILPALPASARELYVNAQAGSDQGSGLSAEKAVKTIRQAVKLARPGDTIQLTPANARFLEPVEFINRSGEPGKPIVVEGNGAVLDGSDPLNVDEWTDQGDGLYRSDVLYAKRRFDAAVVARYFFLFDGKRQLMNRSSKGPTVPFKKPQELAPGEWTFVEAEKAFYLRIEPGQSLKDAKIEHPVRSSGIMIYGGNCEHLVVRNLTVTHFYNDGGNFHARTRDIRIEDVRAIDNGDDGFSAHDDCHVDALNFYASGNSTGVCNTGQSVSHFENLHLDGNIGFEFYALQQTRNTVANSYIASRAARPVAIGTGSETEASQVTFENVLIEQKPREGPLAPAEQALVRVYPGAEFHATNLTSLHFGWLVQGAASVQRSIVAGQNGPFIQTFLTASWTADENLYDLKYIRLDKKFFSPKDFPAYQAETGQDARSQWRSVAADEVLSDPDRSGEASRPGAVPARIPALKTVPTP